MSDTAATTLAPLPSQGYVANKARRTNRGTAFLYLFLVALVCTEASLFRIDDRRINYPLIFSVLILLFPQTLNGLFALRRFNLPQLIVVPLFAYIGFCALSGIWSGSTTETLFHTIIYAAGIMTCLGAVRFKTEDTLTAFVVITTVVCALSWIALPLDPTYALQQKGYWRLRGVMNHEFELGFLAAATLVILAVRWVSPPVVDGTSRKFGWQLYSVAIFCIITLYATQTRTLMVYTMFILMFIGVFYSKGGKRILVMVAGTAIALVGFFFLDDILQAFSRGEGDATLSGRTIIWGRTISLADKVPWTGYGFATFTDERFDYIWYRYRPPHAHDTWIMAYFETGLIGAGLLTLFLLAQLFVGFQITRKLKRPSVGFFLAILCTVSGVTSLIYGGKLGVLICLTLLVLLQEYRDAYPKSAAVAYATRAAKKFTSAVRVRTGHRPATQESIVPSAPDAF